MRHDRNWAMEYLVPATLLILIVWIVGFLIRQYVHPRELHVVKPAYYLVTAAPPHL